MALNQRGKQRSPFSSFGCLDLAPGYPPRLERLDLSTLKDSVNLLIGRLLFGQELVTANNMHIQASEQKPVGLPVLTDWRIRDLHNLQRKTAEWIHVWVDALQAIPKRKSPKLTIDAEIALKFCIWSRRERKSPLSRHRNEGGFVAQTCHAVAQTRLPCSERGKRILKSSSTSDGQKQHQPDQKEAENGSPVHKKTDPARRMLLEEYP